MFKAFSRRIRVGFAATTNASEDNKFIFIFIYSHIQRIVLVIQQCCCTVPIMYQVPIYYIVPIYYSIVPTMYLVFDACVRSVLYSNINLYIRGKHKVDWNFHIKQNFTTKLHGVQSTTVVPCTVLNVKLMRY